MGLLYLLGNNGGSSSPAPLALDSLTSGLLSAWSVRKLITAYAGSCMRVRRSSDSAEQDIGFSGEHFDAAAFSSFVGGGSGAVVTWYDQSGAGKHFTQATTSKQPTVTLAGQNSQPVITFAAASVQCLAVSADKTTYSPFHEATKGTLYIVADNDNNGATKVMLATMNSVADRGFWAYRTSTGSLIQDIGRSLAGGVATATYTPANLSPSLLTMLFDGTNGTAADRVKAWENGSSLTGANVLTGAGTGGDATYDLTLGCRGTQASLAWQGWASELAMWSGDNTSNRTSWESNGKTYWGTP